MIAQELKIFVGGYDLACAFKEFSPSAEAEQLDTTTLCTTGWRTFAPGFAESSISVSGVWDFDGTLLNKINNVLGAAFVNKQNLIVSMSVGEFADTGNAILFSGAQVGLGVETPNGQLIMTSADMQASGLGFGKFHYENEINATSENGASVDNGALSTGGGVFNYHNVYSPTAVSVAQVGFELQHSVDNSTWVALASGALTGIGAGRVVIAPGTTIQRYTRVVFNSPSDRNYGAAAFARN